MNYKIIDGADKLQLSEVMSLLRQTYWANSRTPEQIRKSMENSSCYGIYTDGEGGLVAFARVISDFATTYYLCDVVVDKEYRNKGFGKALVSYIESLPEYQGLRGVLVTRDAHALYEKFGYRTADRRAMIKEPDC